jgi:hypothetical protein
MLRVFKQKLNAWRLPAAPDSLYVVRSDVYRRFFISSNNRVPYRDAPGRLSASP